MKPSAIEVAIAISNHQCPLPRPIDWVLLGKAMRNAIEAGYICDDGYKLGWGGYSLTEMGHETLRDAQK